MLDVVEKRIEEELKKYKKEFRLYSEPTYTDGIADGLYSALLIVRRVRQNEKA